MPDLPVGEALGRELSDLQLLRGQLVPSLGNAAPTPFARRSELTSCMLAPSSTSKCVERVTSTAQHDSRFCDPSLASQPPAIRKLNPGTLKRPACEIAIERIFEEPSGL